MAVFTHYFIQNRQLAFRSSTVILWSVSHTAISFDPSINRCGVCLWDLKETPPEPFSWDLLKPSTMARKDGGWLRKATSITMQVRALTHRFSADLVLIEYPRARPDATSLKASLGGALGKLFVVVGMMAQASISEGAQVKLVPVEQWKGNVPKEVTIDRVLRDYGIAVRDHNIADAIGIGRWYFKERVA